MTQITPDKIRNVAIIAHIDHGKTTLLDGLLKQSAVFRENQAVPERVMDSYDQERERGITIFAKHCSISFGDYKVNIIDTPGHADFSGEVERVLDMVNSVLLLVDAREGPMPQTRYVLSQALKRGLRPLVIINKVDRPHADPDRVLSETFDLFVELSANDEQLNFPYIYASGLSGYACKSLDDPRDSLAPLLQLIVDAVPAPGGELDKPFLMQVATAPYDEYLGRGACGRILHGTVRKGTAVTHVTAQGEQKTLRLTRIKGYHGIQQVDIEEAGAGDIVNLYGVPDVLIGDTLSDPDHVQVLPALRVEEPTISVNFMVNSGPFAGQDGKNITMNKIRDRLNKEKKANITLRIEELPDSQESMRVSGRGELHLAVLIEAMRRESYEFCISKPKVITKQINGILHEALERVYVEVPEENSGAVIDALAKRKGEMQSFDTNEHKITRMEFLIPTRGLMGFRHDFLTMTRGEGILTNIFEDFVPWKGEIPKRKNGVMISMNQGRVTPYACFSLQERGVLLVESNEDTYEGMIVGEHCRDNDIPVNITREKALTNMRAAGKDENIVLTPARKLTLEQAIDYIEDDELVEVTPNHFRFRKIYLKENDRKRAEKHN
ncbi:MAG: translational GTPase TypA [Myxococcaceae bacterium]|nr:translational GTPase TypA [Myxococcaceae bacterium]MBH2006215.1 translational GTPase TypA [Myxococcaceae bacterium]